MVPVTVPAYAAIFAFIYLVLSAQVIRARRRAKAAIGTKGDVSLERRIRVHANFAEYVPFALLLVTFAEMQGGPRWFIHLLCLVLLAGRIIHAYGVSRVREDFRLRTTGMATTFAVIALAALILLARAISAAASSTPDLEVVKQRWRSQPLAISSPPTETPPSRCST